MTSQKQIEANRRNAKKSTGPKTPETKAITRLNSTRDGFTGQVITLSAEDLPIFDAFKSGFIKDLAPKTTMELSLASNIAWDTWRLNHLRAVEMNIYAIGAANNPVDVLTDDPQIHTAVAGAITFVDEAKRFALMSLYEQRMNRSIHKNLATLRELQAERKANYQRDLEEEIILARANDINGLPYEAPAAPTENGYVFSNREIFAAAHRKTVLQASRMTINTTKFKVQFAGASSSQSSNVTEWPKPEAA
jgi:hypothetical protein